MRACSSLSFISLAIRKNNSFKFFFREYKRNYKPGKGSLSSSQLFATSPHFQDW